MSADITLLISICTFIVAMVINIYSFRNNVKKETKEDTTQIAMVMTKLDNIANSIGEIKHDIRDTRETVGAHAERIARIEQEMKTLKQWIAPQNKGGTVK